MTITVEDTVHSSTLILQDKSDFVSDQTVRWCPGCGDFGVLNALQRAVAELGLRPHEIMTISGIGCSFIIGILTRRQKFRRKKPFCLRLFERR